MTAPRRVVLRTRRKVLGGRMDMRVYSDGSMRCRLDHPSNDPAAEMAMAGVIYSRIREVFRNLGMELPTLGPVTWRDDP